MTSKRDGDNDRSSDRIADQVQFGLIFITTFIMLLAAATVDLLLPWKWARLIRSDDKRWLIWRVWEDAGTFTELSFMG
jgi:hypothetical protein